MLSDNVSLFDRKEKLGVKKQQVYMSRKMKEYIEGKDMEVIMYELKQHLATENGKNGIVLYHKIMMSY